MRAPSLKILATVALVLGVLVSAIGLTSAVPGVAGAGDPTYGGTGGTGGLGTGGGPGISANPPISPAYGPGTGGTTVTLYVAGATTNPYVTFGGISATILSSTPLLYGSTQIKVVSPALPQGTPGGPVDVIVDEVDQNVIVTAGTFTYTASIGLDVTCFDPAAGQYTFPTVGVATTVPAPTTLTAPATWSTGVLLQPALPPSLPGDAQVTIDSASASFTAGDYAFELGDTGVLAPHQQSASAVNLPVVSSAAAPPTIVFPTVSWQALAPGPGVVGLTAFTLSVSWVSPTGGSGSTTFSCENSYPNQGQLLASLDVVAGSSSPSLAVSSPVAPLQDQVTAGSDVGWSVVVANTSTVTDKAVSVQVSAIAGAAQATFDLAGMTAAGTTCTGSSGSVTCAIGNLAAGTSRTVVVQVATTGVAAGSVVSGGVSVSSSNATSVSAVLSGASVVELTNGIIGIADPGVPTASAPTPPSESVPAVITLKLPKTKVRKTGLLSRHAAAAKVVPPPVAVTLQALDGTKVPTLCQGNCLGSALQAAGNFGGYADPAHPVKVTVQIYYGASVPTGSVWMLKDNATVVQVPACVKGPGGYNTPCVLGKEKVLGTAGALYTQDVIQFVGGDPVFARR